MNFLNSVLEPSEKEVEIKTYHCTTFKTFNSKSEGYVTVTNKRVVFLGQGSSSMGTSRLISELPIESVSGINSFVGTTFSVAKAIITAILGVILLGQLSSITSRNYSGGTSFNFTALAIVIALGAVIYYLITTIKESTFSLSIFSTTSDSTPITVSGGNLGGLFFNKAAFKALQAEPAEDSDALVKELGAIVFDVKQMGDLAIKKWQRNQPA